VGNGEAVIVPVNHRDPAVQKRTAAYSMFVAAREAGVFFSHLDISADRLAASMLRYPRDKKLRLIDVHETSRKRTITFATPANRLATRII
jgi:hypothetical protein